MFYPYTYIRRDEILYNINYNNMILPKKNFVVYNVNKVKV